MNIEEAIYSYLMRHPDVTALAGVAEASDGTGHRGYPMTIPQSAELPAYAWQVISSQEWMDHAGQSKLFAIRVQFTCQGRKYLEAKELAQALAKTLRGYRGLMGSLWVDGGDILNEFDGYGSTGGVFTTRLDVGIMYRLYGNFPRAAIADVVYNWYVDSVNGSDSYAGTSASRPFATIAKLLTVMGGGETAGLARGSSWREEISLEVNACEFYAYGSGANPILDCCDVIANAGFTKTSGQTNVYEKAVTVEYNAAHPIWNSVWEDGTRLIRAASLAACDSTPGSMYASNDNSASVTLYIHPTGSGNPITNGKLYEFCARRCGVQAYNVTGTYVEGVTCRRNLDEGGSFKMGMNSVLRNCRAEEGNKHSIYIRTGGACYYTTASRAYYNPLSPSKAYFVYNEDNPAGEDILFDGCNTDNGGVYDPNAQAFFGHYNISGLYGTVTCKDCSCADMGSCFDLQHCAEAVITNPTMRNCRQISSVPSNTTISGGSFLNAVANATPITFGSGAGKTLTITGGFDFGTTFTAQNALIFATSAQTIVLDDVKMNLAGSTINVWLNAAGSTLTINGCEFGDGNYVIYAPSGVTLTSDYNTFQSNAGAHFNLNGTTYLTLAAYKAATGQDAHSTIG